MKPKLSNTKWMVFASGYASATVTATWANLNPERSGVAKVKWRLAFCLYREENIGGPAALVFVVPSCLPSWYRRRRWPHIGVQGDWLLIETNYRLLLAIRPLITQSSALLRLSNSITTTRCFKPASGATAGAAAVPTSSHISSG